MPKVTINLPSNYSMKDVRKNISEIPSDTTKVIIREIGTEKLLQVLYIVDGDFSVHPVFPIFF